MSEFVKPSYEYLDHEHANAPEDLLRAGPMDDFEKLDDDTIPTQAQNLETAGKNIFEKGFETEFVGKTNNDFDADSLSSSPIHSASTYAADVAAANLHNAGNHPPSSQALLDFDDDHQKGFEEQNDYLTSNLDLKYPQSLSTDRPLVTQPGADNSVAFGSHDFQASSNTLPETTEVNLTPDPDDKLGLGLHEPFVNVTGNLIGVDNLESRSSHQQSSSPIYPGKLFNAQGYSINPAELDDEEDEEIVEEELEDSTNDFHRGPTHFKLESGPDVLHPSAPDLISNPYQQSHHVEEEEFSELNREDSPPPSYELPEENTAFSSYVSDKKTNNSHQKSDSEEEVGSKPSFISHIKEETMNQSEKFKEVEKEIHSEHHIPKIEELIEELTPPFAACPSAAPPSKIELAKREELSGKCCAFHPRAWFKPEKLDPRVAELIYWRNVKKSGIAFGTGLVVLFSLSYFSFISVVAYLLLAVITGTLSYRIYKNVLQAVQKSSDGHPFKQYLELDLTLPREKVTEGAETFVKHLENAANRLRKLFLIEDLVDSLKFAVLLWCFTYIGAWFNGLTLVTLGFITIFTLPKVYETYKAQIDHYLHIVCSQVGDVVNKVKAKIPIGKKPKQQ